MNIAFFVNKLSDSEQNKAIFQCLNRAVHDEIVSDASLFFTNVGPIGTPTIFGMFNSTDLWNYTGQVIATSIGCIHYAERIANKFKLGYLFSKENNTLGLIDIAKRVPIFAANENDAAECFRLTGRNPRLIELTPKGVAEAFNE